MAKSNYGHLKRHILIDPVKKVVNWLRRNDFEKQESVVEHIETYSEEEERFKMKNIKNDSLYRSYKQFCRYSALRQKVDNNFREMDT